MRFGVLIALLSLACLSVVPGAHANPDTAAFIGPRMQVDAPVFDFGQVEQGEQVTHDFRFTNQGNRDLRVQSVKTSCGCTAAVIAADTIPPGNRGAPFRPRLTPSGLPARRPKTSVSIPTTPSARSRP